MSTIERAKDYVLNVVADDYETFETISREVAEWSNQEGAIVEQDLALEALGSLISAGRVGAYVHSKATNKFERREFDPKQVAEYWFLAVEN